MYGHENNCAPAILGCRRLLSISGAAEVGVESEPAPDFDMRVTRVAALSPATILRSRLLPPPPQIGRLAMKGGTWQLDAARLWGGWVGTVD